MARGWDSKAVEEQIDAAHNLTVAPHGNANGGDAARKRERQVLELARKRLLHRMEASSNPVYQQQLQDALGELDAKLAALK